MKNLIGATGWVVKVKGRKVGAPYTFLTTKTFTNNRQLIIWVSKRLKMVGEKRSIDVIKPL
jgi:hypothetical protein